VACQLEQLESVTKPKKKNNKKQKERYAGKKDGAIPYHEPYIAHTHDY